VIPDVDRYIKGFVYVGRGQQLIPYVPEDIVWMRYFNPLDEYAGLSPVAPLRLSADMGMDALRANRNNLTNDSTPGMFIETTDTPTDDEVREFYERWESRFKGVEKVRRPVLLSGGMKASNLGFSPKDMEYLQTLRWSLEDVGRVYGVPKPMMGDIERITFSNFQTARKVFWEDTIVPQLRFYQETLQHMLLPNLGNDGLGLFVEFDLSVVDALRETENDKAGRRQVYVSTGIMTINEVRKEMNLPPLEWGDEGVGG
jgi:HK97 family phage portal protein